MSLENKILIGKSRKEIRGKILYYKKDVDEAVAELKKKIEKRKKGLINTYNVSKKDEFKIRVDEIEIILKWFKEVFEKWAIKKKNY